MTPPAAPVGPGLGALFIGFLSIGAIGFGGVLPWARRMVVEQRRWLTGADFTELLGLCQFLPGPNIVNLAVVLGARFHGAAGAVAAVAGLLAIPVVVVVSLGALYAAHADTPWVQRMIAGMAAAAAGLVLATALKIAQPLLGRPLALAVAGLAIGAVAWARLPLLPTLALLVPLSLLLHWRAR